MYGKFHPNIMTHSRVVWYSLLRTAGHDPEPIAESRPTEREYAIKDGLKRAARKMGLKAGDQLDEDEMIVPVSDDEATDDEEDNLLGAVGPTPIDSTMDVDASGGYICQFIVLLPSSDAPRRGVYIPPSSPHLRRRRTRDALQDHGPSHRCALHR